MGKCAQFMRDINMDDPPCVVCRQHMDETWLKLNCPCVLYTVWETYQMKTKYK